MGNSVQASLLNSFKTYNMDWTLNVWRCDAEDKWVQTLQKVAKQSIIIFVMIASFELIVKNVVIVTLIKIVTAMSGLISDAKSGSPPGGRNEQASAGPVQPTPTQPKPPQEADEEKEEEKEPVQPRSPQQPHPRQPPHKSQPVPQPRGSGVSPPPSSPLPRSEPNQQPQQPPSSQPQPAPPPPEPSLNPDKTVQVATAATIVGSSLALVVGGPAVLAGAAVGAFALEIIEKTYPNQNPSEASPNQPPPGYMERAANLWRRVKQYPYS